MRHSLGCGCFALTSAGATLLFIATGCQRIGTQSRGPMREAPSRQALSKSDSPSEERKQVGTSPALEDVARKNPRNAGAHARLGREAFDAGDFGGAAQHFRAALRAEPNSCPYALALAQSLTRLAATSMDRKATMEAAARAYRCAQALDPHNFTATVELAACYREQGDYEKAMASLQDAAKLYPEAAAIHTQLGEVYRAQDQLDAALREYKTALRLDASDLGAHNGCGLVNAALAQAGGAKGALARERAIAHYRRSLELSADQPQIRVALQQLQPYQWKAITARQETPD